MVDSYKHCGNCANAAKALNGCYETPDGCKSCVEDQFEVPSNWKPMPQISAELVGGEEKTVAQMRAAILDYCVERTCNDCAIKQRVGNSMRGCAYGTDDEIRRNYLIITGGNPESADLPNHEANETAPLTLADSGNRREFSTGAVRDIQEGKGRCDLLPMDALYQISVADPFWAHIDEFQKNGDIFYLNSVFKLLASKYCPLVNSVVAQADYLLAQAVHMERGAKKYGERNWEKGIPIQSFIDSACRHYLKYMRGDTDEPHLVAAGWNIMCCMTTVIRQKEKDDNDAGDN